MSDYIVKDIEIKAVKYNGKNAREACSIGSYFEKDGRLFDQNGNSVPEGSYATVFPEGYAKTMTASLFEHIFEEKAPETYTFSNIPDISKSRFRRASWNDASYVYWCGIAFAVHTGSDEPDMQYCPTIEDITASDWIIV